jgi:cephalosporin hydroxylase
MTPTHPLRRGLRKLKTWAFLGRPIRRRSAGEEAALAGLYAAWAQPVGPGRPPGERPALTAEEEQVVDRFHDLYYRKNGAYCWFLGHQAMKSPLDLWVYQEIVAETRPDFVVETGTLHGASALWLAAVCQMVGHGRVVTIDKRRRPECPEHPLIDYVQGYSTEPATVGKVRDYIAGGRAMVILDSSHRMEHVLDELQRYAPLVAPGCYLIVEDTNVNGHPTYPDYGPGPMEALDAFLETDDAFEIDRGRERFFLTMNPRGYLRRTGG